MRVEGRAEVSARASKRSPSSWRRSLAFAAGLLALAALCVWGRKVWIRGFFVDGPQRVAPAALESSGPPGRPVRPVRVVLIDGLGADAAAALPNLQRLCARGVTMTVDDGFPTVSLPVQHVLWTGRPQWASGVLYRIPRLDTAPLDALPAAVPGSRAVAESHVDIVHSFGFETAVPATEDEVDDDWREGGFDAAAREAIASAAPLVFVHALRVDEAGHQSGAASDDYAQAAVEIDDYLPGWVAAAPDADWWITADHGHRAAGGHGGNEEAIRVVQACHFGSGVAASSATQATTLPALALAVRTAVGVRGRSDTLDIAWPALSLWRALCAASLLFGALFAAWRFAARRYLVWGVVWPAICALGFAALHGAPSLSIPAVYPPLGLAAAKAGALGSIMPMGLLLASEFASRSREGDLVRVLFALFVPSFGAVLALHALAGSGAWLVSGTPPLVPTWTAWASVGTVWFASALASASLGLVFIGLRSGSRRA